MGSSGVWWEAVMGQGLGVVQGVMERAGVWLRAVICSVGVLYVAAIVRFELP